MYGTRLVSCFSRFVQRNNVFVPCALSSRYVHRKTVEDEAPSGSSYITVYQFPHMTACSLLNKFKKYQLVLVGAGIPVVFALDCVELVDHSTFIAFSGTGFASSASLFAVCHFFTNLVGFVYVSKDKSQVKFSYLNYWGRRVDKTVPIENVVGITRKSRLPWDYLHVANDPTPYKISLRFGEIFITPLFRSALKHDPDE